VQLTAQAKAMASVHQSALVLDQTSVTEWATQRVPLLDASLEPLKVKGWARVLALASALVSVMPWVKESGLHSVLASVQA
jgi:hypothetical protein